MNRKKRRSSSRARSSKTWRSVSRRALGERVKDVRVSARLTESAACIVSDEHEMSGHLQRLLKAAGQKTPESPPILELNPHHPLVARLKTDERDLADWAQLLLDEAATGRRRGAERPGSFRATGQSPAAGRWPLAHARAPRAPVRGHDCADFRRSSTPGSSASSSAAFRRPRRWPRASTTRIRATSSGRSSDG